jgi:hypothetical protein
MWVIGMSSFAAGSKACSPPVFSHPLIVRPATDPSLGLAEYGGAVVRAAGSPDDRPGAGRSPGRQAGDRPVGDLSTSLDPESEEPHAPGNWQGNNAMTESSEFGSGIAWPLTSLARPDRRTALP